MEFRAEGRLGCPNDYDVFRAGLEPLLQRLHRSVRHKGKSPRHGQSLGKASAEMIELRSRLRLVVEAENYEEAALLRDQIRQKEAADGPGESDKN
jgi:protein arginine kinase activator